MLKKIIACAALVAALIMGGSLLILIRLKQLMYGYVVILDMIITFQLKE